MQFKSEPILAIKAMDDKTGEFEEIGRAHV